MSRDEILDLFRIDLRAGRLFWKKPPKYHPRLRGLEAGAARAGRNSKRYWMVKINGKAWKRSVLIFLAKHGRFASPMIDHKNGDSLDDRPCNLREATAHQNAWNHKSRKKKSKLPMGVKLTAQGRYQARIQHYGNSISLGVYDTPTKASGIYRKKRKALFGAFAG